MTRDELLAHLLLFEGPAELLEHLLAVHGIEAWDEDEDLRELDHRHLAEHKRRAA